MAERTDDAQSIRHRRLARDATCTDQGHRLDVSGADTIGWRAQIDRPAHQEVHTVHLRQRGHLLRLRSAASRRQLSALQSGRAGSRSYCRTERCLPCLSSLPRTPAAMSRMFAASESMEAGNRRSCRRRRNGCWRALVAMATTSTPLGSGRQLRSNRLFAGSRAS